MMNTLIFFHVFSLSNFCSHSPVVALKHHIWLRWQVWPSLVRSYWWWLGLAYKWLKVHILFFSCEVGCRVLSAIPLFILLFSNFHNVNMIQPTTLCIYDQSFALLCPFDIQILLCVILTKTLHHLFQGSCPWVLAQHQDMGWKFKFVHGGDVWLFSSAVVCWESKHFFWLCERNVIWVNEVGCQIDSQSCVP